MTGFSDLGDALLDVLDRQAGEEEAGAFDLDPVVKKGHADGRPTVRIVGVNERVDHHFTENPNRNAPKVLAADL